MRRLTLPESVKHWSLRSVQTKLIKIDGRDGDDGVVNCLMGHGYAPRRGWIPAFGDSCIPGAFRRKPESRPRLNIEASLRILAFHPHPNPLPSRERGLIKGLPSRERRWWPRETEGWVPVFGDPCTTPSFRRKPESRPRLNIEASLRILAFHPHPNPLPSRERGLRKGLPSRERRWKAGYT